MAAFDPEENGANGNSELSPASPSEINQELQKRVGRRLSGFAAPGYYDEIDEETGLTRREAKSQWAKQRIAEGKLGGRQPGAGRPRKNKSVAEVVAEKSSEKADKIANKLLDLALNHNAPSINLGAIDRLNKYEQDFEKNMRDDEKELRKLSGKSLDQALQEVLSEHGIGYDYDVPSEDIEDA